MKRRQERHAEGGRRGGIRGCRVFTTVHGKEKPIVSRILDWFLLVIKHERMSYVAHEV